MLDLRQYQEDLKNDVYAEWDAGHQNVAAVLPTGGGKSALMARIIGEVDDPSVAIAHRQELVSQIGLALARDGIRHKFIAPEKVRRNCIRIQEMELGYSTFDPLAKRAVAGVDTLIKMSSDDPFIKKVRLWATDEVHHLLRANKWGTAVQMMPNARGLGGTATLFRPDGKGLGRRADGLIDSFVEGPTMRQLILMAFLTDYRIFAPPSDINLSEVDVSEATGDFNQDQLRKAVHKSHIVGDVVSHYLKIAPGKRGITFAVDIQSANELAQAFNEAGVPAAAVSSKTDDLTRAYTLRRFKNGEILQLVNVDLFGEGFDVPACEVVSMARPTESLVVFIQQFGRALRLFDGKHWGIIIDHVGNVLRHGLPDAPRSWSLDRRERRGKSAGSDIMPVRACPECTAVYERIHVACPFCGYKPEPAGRSLPEQVDGDLYELDPVVLATMRKEIDRVDGIVFYPQNASPVVRNSIHKRHLERQEAQQSLRAVISLWAGQWRDIHRSSDNEIYRRFFYTFGTDIMTAQTLGANDAHDLTQKVIARMS